MPQVGQLHGSLTQAQRIEALAKFKRREVCETMCCEMKELAVGCPLLDGSRISWSRH